MYIIYYLTTLEFCFKSNSIYYACGSVSRMNLTWFNCRMHEREWEEEKRPRTETKRTHRKQLINVDMDSVEPHKFSPSTVVDPLEFHVFV